MSGQEFGPLINLHDLSSHIDIDFLADPSMGDGVVATLDHDMTIPLDLESIGRQQIERLLRQWEQGVDLHLMEAG